MSKLQRFGISMPDALLNAFDAVITEKGYANRSEAIRDIVRDYLVEREWEAPDAQVVGTITIVYDHHVQGLESRLIGLQHDHSHIGIVQCTTHVHLDEENCVEVMVVRGTAATVRRLADSIISARGVKHGELTCTGAALLHHGTQSDHHHHHHDELTEA